MSYHYEMKTVIKNKWIVYGFSFSAICSFIVMMIMLSGTAELKPIIFWSMFIQFMCGGLIVFKNLDYKKVRVPNKVEPAGP